MRKDYEMLGAGAGLFRFDPFGDFDLVFGAAKQPLKIIETPVRTRRVLSVRPGYRVFRDGWFLLKMVLFAYRKLKAV
jgi:hypothetical protein